jgi:Anthrone oxygenase
VDRLQPALLVVCLGSTIGFASSTDGAARTLATLAAGGLLVMLVGSVAVLVPIQRRLVASESPPPSAVEALRARWCGGHLVRTAVALACFVLAVVATII